MNLPNTDEAYDLEHFIELSPDWICIAGYDGYFKKINPAVSKTLGYSNEELLSRPIHTFVLQEDKELTARTREEVVKGKPLLNYENRYVTKTGEHVWMLWTSMPIEDKKLVFAIAKNITHRKKLEEYRRVANILNNKFKLINADKSEVILSISDQVWLNDLEALIREYTDKGNLNISILSHELSISERQLHRRINAILGITPNKYIRIVRLQMAKEAIETGRFRTLSEIAYAAGFETPGYFRKLFKEVHGYDVAELL